MILMHISNPEVQIAGPGMKTTQIFGWAKDMMAIVSLKGPIVDEWFCEKSLKDSDHTEWKEEFGLRPTTQDEAWVACEKEYVYRINVRENKQLEVFLWHRCITHEKIFDDEDDE